MNSAFMKASSMPAPAPIMHIDDAPTAIARALRPITLVGHIFGVTHTNATKRVRHVLLAWCVFATTLHITCTAATGVAIVREGLPSNVLYPACI